MGSHPQLFVELIPDTTVNKKWAFVLLGIVRFYFGVSDPKFKWTNASESKFDPKIFSFLVYVDASPNCNTLAFQLGNTGVYTTLATRQWNIKVSHQAVKKGSLLKFACRSNKDCERIHI